MVRTRSVLVVTVALAATSFAAPAASAAPAGPRLFVAGAGASASDWLGIVNGYRAYAGLPPVSEDPAWSDGGAKHARYTVETNVLAHSEDPSNPWFTPEGDAAAKSGNVFASSNAATTALDAIRGWITGPFHALGILDPGLTKSGFGDHSDPSSSFPYRYAATLDVIRGLGPAPAGTPFPVLFPGSGVTSTLTTYAGGESPDPLAPCPGYTVPAGAPIMARFATLPTLTGLPTLTANGVPVDSCGYDHTVGGSQGSSLTSRRSVVVMPRAPLAPGATYAVSIPTDLGTASWSFAVGSSCPGFFGHPVSQRVGTAGDDALVGTEAADLMCGLGGNDVMEGGGGDDTLLGDEGNDVLRGGDGDDLVMGGDGNDTLRGDGGRDDLLGEGGNDKANGGGGPDDIRGGDGNDRLNGKGGKDLILGENGKDRMNGGSGKDVLKGGKGNDTLNGGAGKDRCKQQQGKGPVKKCEKT